MNTEPRAEICDINRPILTHSAISQNSVEFQMNNQNGGESNMDTAELSKKVLKLELTQRTDPEKGSVDEDEKDSKLTDIKSPKSPLSNSSKRIFNSFHISKIFAEKHTHARATGTIYIIKFLCLKLSYL